MKTRRASGLLAAWLICSAVACSDGKTPGDKAEMPAIDDSVEVCGNDIREKSETCDGSDVGLETCVAQGFDTGTLACNDTCTGFDTTLCITNPARCLYTTSCWSEPRHHAYCIRQR